MLPFYLINKFPPLKHKLRSMYLHRARQIVPHITPFITKADRVLDLGCGTGSIIKLVKKSARCQATLVDVQYNAMCDQYPVLIYDGRQLPFATRQFTTTLVTAVLHHTQDPHQVLSEAKRVTSKQIIVMEDVFSDVFSRLITFVGDCLLNWEIHSPFTNHTVTDWTKIFNRHHLRISHFEEFHLRCVGFPFKLALFVLTPTHRHS